MLKPPKLPSSSVLRPTAPQLREHMQVVQVTLPAHTSTTTLTERQAESSTAKIWGV